MHTQYARIVTLQAPARLALCAAKNKLAVQYEQQAWQSNTQVAHTNARSGLREQAFLGRASNRKRTIRETTW